MRGTLLALASLALLIAAAEGKGEANAVKLCGRDFVRAIVFTCGGSRWRRQLPDYPYLFESENALPSSQESTGYADSSLYADQRLEADSEEIPSVEPETERDLQRARKMSTLKKREVAKLLTTSCCSVGCTERDLRSLC
ncbi:insulin-like peptide INSL5 [Opisthocomus hoazin]|uniref:insulin-like peptide INSL5 n=1 Tax=Opisthocomus hoazin TaxID=30419 RepID=UPI003F530E9B